MKAKLSIITVVILFAASGLYAVPDKIFTSSGYILPGEEWNIVRIYNDDTVVHMLGGMADAVLTFDRSTLNVLGGATEVMGWDYSIINVSGGNIKFASAWGNSNVNFFGSDYTKGLGARDFGTANMIGGHAEHASALEHGILNIFDGTISDGIGAGNHGTINMFGGTTQSTNFIDESTVNLFGGTILDFLLATENSTVNIFGYDLVKTSSGGSYGYGQVYGFWLNDIPFSIDLNGSDTYDHINLIPEPASLILFGLGSLVLRRKR